MDDHRIALHPDTIVVLERRARAFGSTPEDYAATLLERILDGFETQDSVDRACRRRIAELRGPVTA